MSGIGNGLLKLQNEHLVGVVYDVVKVASTMQNMNAMGHVGEARLMVDKQVVRGMVW